jgi:alkyl hydroperoxide reductase subunit AhpF
MSDETRTCDARATLIVTLTPAGTATNVARERIGLRCGLPAGHAGAHVDAERAEQWEAPRDSRPTLLRHEDD